MTPGILKCTLCNALVSSTRKAQSPPLPPMTSPIDPLHSANLEYRIRELEARVLDIERLRARAEKAESEVENLTRLVRGARDLAAANFARAERAEAAVLATTSATATDEKSRTSEPEK